MTFEEWYNNYLKTKGYVPTTLEVWQAATKAALGSRVVLPSDEEINKQASFLYRYYPDELAELVKWISSNIKKRLAGEYEPQHTPYISEFDKDKIKGES